MGVKFSESDVNEIRRRDNFENDGGSQNIGKRGVRKYRGIFGTIPLEAKKDGVSLISGS